MEKYLFTDGTNEVREVQSDEELQSLISAVSDPVKIRIWVFNTNEWIPYSEFSKRFNAAKKQPVNLSDTPARQKAPIAAKPGRKAIRWMLILLAVAAVLLIYNFTRIKWYKIEPLEVEALRPSNVPVINLDSLVAMIEFTRRQKLDKVTSTNLRIRNSWPDRVTLKLQTDRDSSQDEIKYYNIGLGIDNSTGYQIDQAIVELTSWKNREPVKVDTIHFENVSYSARSKRSLANEYRGDSISVQFLSVRAKAFNFCYEAGKEGNSGNLNDRWFCKD